MNLLTGAFKMITVLTFRCKGCNAQTCDVIIRVDAQWGIPRFSPRDVCYISSAFDDKVNWALISETTEVDLHSAPLR